MTALNPIPTTLIPGDGIGPEVVKATVTVLEALGAPFKWETQLAGMAAFNTCGDPMPQPLLFWPLRWVGSSVHTILR